jgi:Polyketide cyclase / dehydrase and lipid transport
MAKLEFAVEITAPPDRVAVFFVPQRMPYWYGAEMECEFEVGGGAADFRRGLKVHIAGRLGPRAVSLTAVVTRFDWGRLLEWRFQDAYGVRGLQRWEIGPGALGARVRMCDEYEFPGTLGRIFDWLLTRHAVARRDLSDLARLKRIAEQP